MILNFFIHCMEEQWMKNYVLVIKKYDLMLQ